MNLKYNKDFFEKEFLPKIEQGWSAEQMGKYVGKQSGGISMWHCAKKYATLEQLEVLKINGKTAQQNARSSTNKKQITIKERDKSKLPEIINLVNRGYNVYEISKQIHLWPGTVYRILQRDNNISTVQKLKLNSEKSRINNNKLKGKKISKARREIYDSIFNDVKLLVEQGLTSKQIGDLFNRHHQAIRNLVKRCGDSKLFVTLLDNNAKRRRDVAYSNFINAGKTKTSKCEKMLYEIVLKYFPNAVSTHPIKRQDGYFWIIDVAILEHKLAIEYDDSYWHDTRKDKIRDQALYDLGWKTLRLKYKYTPAYQDLEQHFLTKVKEFIS
jgi:very-short-patch-repair endonuclease/DNA-binding NarL/FixJ family response regulator